MWNLIASRLTWLGRLEISVSSYRAPRSCEWTNMIHQPRFVIEGTATGVSSRQLPMVGYVTYIFGYDLDRRRDQLVLHAAIADANEEQVPWWRWLVRLILLLFRACSVVDATLCSSGLLREKKWLWSTEYCAMILQKAICTTVNPSELVGSWRVLWTMICGHSIS